MPGPVAADQAREQRQVNRAQRLETLVMLLEDPLGQARDVLAGLWGDEDERDPSVAPTVRRDDRVFTVAEQEVDARQVADVLDELVDGRPIEEVGGALEGVRPVLRGQPGRGRGVMALRPMTTTRSTSRRSVPDGAARSGARPRPTYQPRVCDGPETWTAGKRAGIAADARTCSPPSRTAT